VIRSEALSTEPASLETFAKAQEELVRTLVPGVEVFSRGNTPVGAERIPGITQEFFFSDGVRTMSQIQIYWLVGQRFYALCGTANVGSAFAAMKEQVQRVVESFTFGE